MSKLIVIVEDNLNSVWTLQQDPSLAAKHISLQVWYHPNSTIASQQALTTLKTLKPDLLLLDSLSNDYWLASLITTARSLNIPTALLTVSPEMTAPCIQNLAIRVLPKTTSHKLLVATFQLMMH